MLHLQTESVCRKYYLQHGFGDPVVLKEGVLCAVLHRQVKEYTRARIELVTTSGRVSKGFVDSYIFIRIRKLLVVYLFSNITSWYLHLICVGDTVASCAPPWIKWYGFKRWPVTLRCVLDQDNLLQGLDTKGTHEAN